MTDIINMPPQHTVDLTDHNALITLVESVKNIKEGQDKFHVDIKAQIEDLKNNFAGRLETVEAFQRNADKVFTAKIDQDKCNDAIDARVTTLETWQNRIIGGLILFNVILGVVLAYISIKG